MFGPPPRDYEAEESRRSALWGLAALGIIAVLVVVVMLAFTSSGGHHHNTAQNPPVSTVPSEPASTTPTATTPSAASTTPPSHTPGTTPALASAGNPCPSPAPCAVPGDAARLVTAVNAFRAAHQLPAVPGTVSPQAQQCALAQGNGPACAPSYSWEPVPTQSAAQVIALIASRDGGKWLLDPSMISFSVGWAYMPAVAGAPGQWQSAILKIRGQQQDQQD
jgi:cytoskeletal protein RodZ